MSRPDGGNGDEGGVIGRVLCRLDAIPEGGAKGFETGEGEQRLRIFVLRRGAALHGYVNSCPHVGTPLDWTPDRFLNADGTAIQCATHGAQFRIEDGYCFSGPCAGKRLRPVVLRLERDSLVLNRKGIPWGREF